MAIDAGDWYDQDPDPTGLYQGDILQGVPVVFMPPASGRWILLRPTLPVTLAEALGGNIPKSFRPYVESKAPDPWDTPDELVLAKAAKRAIIVITQTCDLERRNFVQVAPVYSSETLGQKKQASLEMNEINYLFYLPKAEPSIPEKSFADLSQITSVHNSYLREAKLGRRLSNHARAALQQHLANFHGRPFGFSTTDIVPQTGDYVCLRCFLTVALVQRVFMTAPTGFSDCPRCGNQALWIKLP